MKRVIFLLTLMAVGTAGLWQQTAVAAELWANKSGWVNLPGYGQLEHTYACCRISPSLPATCRGNPGSASGGSYLTSTRSYSGNCIKMICAASGLCAITWGVTGTCHQGANRMLRTGGTTVSRASGYSLSSRLFGTYGTNASWTSCRARCGI